MIAYLEGIFKYKDLEFVVIDVNGVGYALYIKNKDAESLEKGVHYNFFVQSFFREQVGFELYGFFSLKEKNIFNELIKVNKVGNKTALAILNQIYTEDLISAIIDKDINILSSVKGIGKKTSERIILELSDKFKKKFTSKISKNKNLSIQDSSLNLIKDLDSVLGNLGYSSKSIKMVLESFTKEELDTNDLEELIKISLKRIRNL